MPLMPFPAPLQVQRPPSFVVNTASYESLGPQIPMLTASSVASAIWPTTNLALFIPFRLTQPQLALQMFSYNGATAAANLDVGIYNAAGNQLVSIGSTLQAGTNAIQLFNIADTWLDAGVTYYMAIAANNITPTLMRWTGVNAGQVAAMGVLQMGTAFALPATATYAACTTNYLPCIGISFVATF